MKAHLLALGDSISCGEGVGVRVHPAHTWVGALAQALDLEVELLASRGERVHGVLVDQVPVAVANPAPLTTLLIGLNDVSRTGWDAHGVARDLQATVGRLRATGTTILLGRLHDPTMFLPLPSRIRAQALQRVRVVNAAVDAARRPGVVVLDLAAVAELRTRSGWAVDRVHPSVSGHRAIAAAALNVLSLNGIHAPNALGPPSVARCPGRVAEALWLARHGVPYLVQKADRVFAPAGPIRLAVLPSTSSEASSADEDFQSSLAG